MEQMLYERIQIMFRILSAFRRLNSFQIIVLGFLRDLARRRHPDAAGILPRTEAGLRL